ncbi:diguanylate cyclase [Rhizobium sp. TRM95111]|uniref:GGDEF domain-containing protein n=1 Tax=Rhizobium alarense TaxID=2846851 RepID=UPI001F3641E0|nr:sensor domain-containing diguanylate cyclase [Rhizobium alarense]MCF3639510.1 diguanylate cyclase [Rhizobium alarense]
MVLDYWTLLLAIGLSAFCLAGTLFAAWLAARVERFMLSWSVGMWAVVAAVVFYSVYVKAPSAILAGCWFVALLTGFSFIWGAAYRYRTDRPGRVTTVRAAAVGCTVTVAPLIFGLDGVGFIALNLCAATLLALTASEYWRCRAEAPLPTVGIVVLYALTAVSFALCAAVLLSERRWVLGHAPQNWAENVNLVMSVIGITGIGAMSLALNQWRIASRHRRDAMTDALTGLLNRRALFDRYGAQPVGPHTAVLAFDLDGFKAINDRHGHAVGDRVLRVFASVLSDACRHTDTIARLGGEEFAVVLDRTVADRATAIAERIRKTFETSIIQFDGGSIHCTVSAGIAFGREGGAPFDTVLNGADKALYASKRGGRNRVSLATDGLRLVV